MSLLRNRSFAVELAVMAGALGAVAALAGALAGPAAGCASLCSLAATCALFAAFSARRYREIARLAAEVDEVLHGGRRIAFADYREGDVAVLKNELAKMTAALTGATERLGQEKAALADALADVSHQIRTPLTAIGLLVPAIEDATGPAERTRALRELEALVERVGWLVTTLLKLAKADAGAIRVQAAPVDVERIVRDALAPLAGAFDLRGVACEVNVAPGATFTGDAAWSAEALGNVLKNLPRAHARRRHRARERAGGRGGAAPACHGHGPRHRGRGPAAPVRALLPRGGVGRLRHRAPARPLAHHRPRRDAARRQRPRDGRRALRLRVPQDGGVTRGPAKAKMTIS